MIEICRRLLTENDGQDILEYGLLGALVAVGTILAWQAIVAQVAAAYTSADAAVQSQSACTPNPGGGGC
jgi:Flp pilus assembly pilin Flp